MWPGRAPLPLLTLLLGLPIGTSLGAQGSIRGTVFDSLFTKAPLAGAQVVVQGAPLSAVTDRRGRFTIRDVPPGRHRVAFFHPTLDTLEISAPSQLVDVAADGSASVALGIPSARGLNQRFCEAEQAPFTAVVFGIARVAESGAPLVGATASVRWYEVSIASGTARQVERATVGVTGEDGRYMLCGVPNDISVSLSVVAERQSTGLLHLSLDGGEFARFDAAVSLSDSAATVPHAESVEDSARTTRTPGNARVLVRVRNENGRPIRGAIVGVRGTAASAVTGEDGSARIMGAPAGSQTLVTRAIGLAPMMRVVPLAPGGETSVEFRLRRAPTALPPVAVTGVRKSPMDIGFETRRRGGFGHFFSGKELDFARISTSFWTRMPGVFLYYGSMVGDDPLPVMTAPIPSPSNGGRCIPTVWLDGTMQYSMNGWELRALMLGAHRLEVYARQALVPLEFMTASNACGAILIWTH